jgi:hypothetical protein
MKSEMQANNAGSSFGPWHSGHSYWHSAGGTVQLPTQAACCACCIASHPGTGVQFGGSLALPGVQICPQTADPTATPAHRAVHDAWLSYDMQYAGLVLGLEARAAGLGLVPADAQPARVAAAMMIARAPFMFAPRWW